MLTNKVKSLLTKEQISIIERFIKNFIMTPEQLHTYDLIVNDGYDPVTKTTAMARAKAIDGYCYNIIKELVYIGDKKKGDNDY